MKYNAAIAEARRYAKKTGQGVYVVNIYGIEDIDAKGRPISRDSCYDVIPDRDFDIAFYDMSEASMRSRIRAHF